MGADPAAETLCSGVKYRSLQNYQFLSGVKTSISGINFLLISS
jgi:hypothetical protein